MTKAITGTIHNTSFGLFIIPDDQKMVLSVGDTVCLKGQNYAIIGIVPPTRPDAKWSLKVSVLSELL